VVDDRYIPQRRGSHQPHYLLIFGGSPEFESCPLLKPRPFVAMQHTWSRQPNRKGTPVQAGHKLEASLAQSPIKDASGSTCFLCPSTNLSEMPYFSFTLTKKKIYIYISDASLLKEIFQSVSPKFSRRASGTRSLSFRYLIAHFIWYSKRIKTSSDNTAVASVHTHTHTLSLKKTVLRRHIHLTQFHSFAERQN